jgi:hypothetical protein
MANPSYTYTLTNGTTADATQVMQDFNDILNGVTDGTKDLSISALTVAGTATLNGNINLGNASADDLTITASLASSLAIKTNNTYDIGSATLGLRKLYLGNGGAGATCDVVSASHATTREYTIPDCSAAANFVMTQGTQTVAGSTTFSLATTFSNGIVLNNLLGDITATSANQTATMTIATPGVVTSNSHGMSNGDKFYFLTTGALPTGVSASTTYYASNVAANTFNISTTLANAMAGTYVATSGSQSGVHTLYTGGLNIGTQQRGRTLGSAASAGYIGESGYGSETANTAMSHGAYVTGATATLTAGTFLCLAYITKINVTANVGERIFVGLASNSGSYADIVQVTVNKTDGSLSTDLSNFCSGVVNFASTDSSAVRTVAVRCQVAVGVSITGTFTSQIFWVRIA